MYLTRCKAIIISIVVLALSLFCIGLIIYMALSTENNGSNNDQFNDALQLDCSTAPATTVSTGQYPWERQLRLPSDVIPKLYSIYLFPSLENGTYQGHVNITIDITRGNRTFIWMHIHTSMLTVTKTNIFDTKGQFSGYQVINTQYYDPNQFIILELNKPLNAGVFILQLEFFGNMTQDMNGFYRSSYVDEKGQTRYLATSKMEPTHARQAFPCFDEPNLKANFSVTLVRPAENYIALSNMPIQKENKDCPIPGVVETIFQTSLPMSTYLVAFIVCDFGHLQSQTKSGIIFKSFAVQFNLTAYALRAGTIIMQFYEEYFQIKYPLIKQDLIAIPDFVTGAMENWGLITFRETLIFNENKSTELAKQKIATTVAHELSHMWFGDLVTMSWWDDLWLNEGFATYMSYKGVAHLEDWDIESQFLTSTLHPALDIDYQNSSHAIIQAINNPDDINEIFDTISYNKGASVLRMLENAVGSEQFRSGLTSYLNKHKYGNTRTQDLWDELQIITKFPKNITSFMNSWTTQIGYPIITITDENDVYTLQQEIFYGSLEEKQYYQSQNKIITWDIFITYVSFTGLSLNLNDSQSIWMLMNETKKTIPKSASDNLIKLNIGQYGYFRVNYDNSTWGRLTDFLLTDLQRMPVSDRANLLDDSFALSKSGYLNYSIALNLSTYLRQERHYIPWNRATLVFRYISGNLWNQPYYDKWQLFVLSLVNGTYNDVGWKDEGDHLTKLLRSDIIHLACSNDHSHCLDTASNHFSNWIKNETYYISPNLRNQVYRYGMSTIGTLVEWDVMWERYLKQIYAEEKMNLLCGMAWNKETWILQRYITYVLDPDKVRAQDVFTVLACISSNPVGTTVVWDYVRKEWSNLVRRFTLNRRSLEHFIQEITSSFNTEVKEKELQTFYKENPETGAGKISRKNAAYQVSNNIKWVNRSADYIGQWLQVLKFNDTLYNSK